MYLNVASSSGLSGFGAIPRRPLRRVSNLLPRRRRRGMSGLGWLSYPYYTPTQVMVSVPQPGGLVTQLPTAETELQNAAAQDINDPAQFTAQYNSPEYASPAAYTANMISYAKTLCYGSWAAYTCAGFDPVAMGTKYANLVFSTLQQIPVDVNDLSKGSVYAAWLAAPPGIPPAYTPPAPVQPFTPAALPPAIVATLPPAVQNYVPPGVTPAPAPAGGGSLTPAATPPGVQNWLPPISAPAPAASSPPSLIPAGVDLSFLTNPISIFGYNVPLWMLVAGGVGVAVMAGSAGGRR